MVEALSTSFQNVYNKYTRSEKADNTLQDNRRELYIVPVNNITTNNENGVHQRTRIKSRRGLGFDVKHLCIAKELTWQIVRQEGMRPLMGQCCTVCIPYTVKGNSKITSNVKNLLDIYNIRLFKKSTFGRFVDHLKFFYQLKNQEYKYIYNEVLEDESVMKVIKTIAREACDDNSADSERRFNEEMKTQQENTIRILTVMRAKVKNWVYKVVGWFTFRMVSLLATSLVVQPSQIEKVSEAEQSGLPVIYLPLHKSHMDYILLGLVLIMHNIKPPLVAAGDNLRIFFISKLLSYLGAFYIKRQVDKKKDQLYWTILSSYIKNSLKSGHHIEFFLEGARTRSGKCCVPKGGILSIVVDAYREGIIEDAWIVPVSMNYDRILEGNFVREQLGQPKKKETFFAAILTFVKAIYSHYGIMRVDFNTPYRLRDLYESIDKKFKLENTMLRNKGLEEELSENFPYKIIIDRMAKHIVYDCWKSTAIMSTNAVSFILLKKYRNGTTIEQLALELSNLCNKLSQADRDVGFSGNSKHVVKHALSLLTPKLISYEKTSDGLIVKPNLDVPSLIELSYYGNNLISHYFHQSIVAVSLSKLVCPEFWNRTINETRISRKSLIDSVVFIIELLQYDFVFIKPCQSLDNIIDRVIRDFEEEEIILLDMLLNEEKRSKNVAKYFDDDSDDDCQQRYVEYDVNYRISAHEDSLNKIKFYRSIMMPYLECMAECAGSFLELQENSVSEHDHIQSILKQMHENLEEGVLYYGESISVETIKHSFLAFEKFNCLTITTKDNVKMLSMNITEFNDQTKNMINMLDYIETLVKQIN